MLNTAEGNRNGTVDTNQVSGYFVIFNSKFYRFQAFYKPFGMKYKGLELVDVAQTNIATHFNDVAEFIDEALADGGNNSR